MRIRATMLISVLALAGCARASAATVDPNDDFDCAATAGFFREVAKLQNDAPDKARQVLFIPYLWYGAKWDHDHPAGKDAELLNHKTAMVTAMGKDALSYREPLKACAARAAA